MLKLMSLNINTSNNTTSVLPGVTIADIESQSTNHSTDNVKPQKVNTAPIKSDSAFALCCAYSCVGFTVIVLLSPFIICDLYFAFNSISCQHVETPIGITLTTWLLTAGFSLVGLIVTFALGLGVIACCGCDKDSMILFVPIQWAFSLFSFAWLIVGCVLFWRYLDPSGDCARDVSDYMWARLIIGLIGVFISSKSGDKKKK